MFNTLGKILSLTSFGESHGKAIGGIIDGFPAGIHIDFVEIQEALNRRRPGQSKITTARNEPDRVEFLSGIYQGKSTGHPIAFQIKNTNQKSKDYQHNTEVFRPSHADFTYFEKYGIRDPNGGGRSSARETANWVVAGTLAKQILPDLQINAYVSSIGEISIQNDKKIHFLEDENEVRCPDHDTAKEMIEYIQKIKKAGDTVGGTINCIINNVPVGLGEPIFNKLQAALAHAMLSINAVKGFEYGSGFEGTRMKGSEHNDIFIEKGKTKTNFSGGIQGGISNGMPIEFRLAFKPVATIMQNQNTIDSVGNRVEIHGKGRHDVCVVPRAVPIVEALSAFIMADFFLLNKVRRF